MKFLEGRPRRGRPSMFHVKHFLALIFLDNRRAAGAAKSRREPANASQNVAKSSCFGGLRRRYLDRGWLTESGNFGWWDSPPRLPSVDEKDQPVPAGWRRGR